MEKEQNQNLEETEIKEAVAENTEQDSNTEEKNRIN